MSKANITLRDEDFFLFLPTIKTSLNFANVGPEEVDTELLNDMDYLTLKTAVECGKIECDIELEPRGQLILPQQVAEPVVPQEDGIRQISLKQKQPVQQPMANQVNIPFNENRVRHKELIAMLQSNMNTVKKNLKDIDDLRELRFLLQSERRGKKRKNIIKIIENLIEKITNDAIIAARVEEKVVVPREIQKQMRIGKTFAVDEDDADNIAVEIQFPEYLES